jgi:hypothetical protein
MSSQSDSFNQTLVLLLQDPAVTQKNALLQNATLQGQYVARAEAITQDVVIRLRVGDVLTASPNQPKGALERNYAKAAVELDTAGFKYALSKFRDGTHTTPRRIRRREPGDGLFTTPADRIRYVVADSSDGVTFLDANLEIVRTLPGLAPLATPSSGGQYQAAKGACAATLGATEYVFVACDSRHIVQIYNLATGASVATIGVHATSGLPDDLPAARLTNPVSVTVDEANSRLFVVCSQGTATGATGDGFVCEFDVTAPATPVFVSYTLIASGLNRLNNAQVSEPSDAFFVPGATVADGRLWVANGLGDVGVFARAALVDPFSPQLVLEAVGPDYVLGPDTTLTATLANNSIDVLLGSDGSQRLFVAVDQLGVVEVFRVGGTVTSVAVGTKEATYGYHGFEDFLPYNVRLPPQASVHEPALTFGSLASPAGVVADELTLTGDTVVSKLLVVGDSQAGRLQRLNANIYDDVNEITFAAITFGVDTRIDGWAIAGSLPPEYVFVDVRDPGDATVTPVIPVGDYQEVSRLCGSTLPAATRMQIRVRVKLPRTAPVTNYNIKELLLLLTQV